MLARNAAKIALVLVVLFAVGGAWFWSPLDKPSREQMTLAEPATHAIETTRQMTEMLTTLAVTLIGGALYFFVQHLERPLLMRPVDKLLWVFALSAGAGSLYCGYLTYHVMLDMISQSTFDPQGFGLVSTLRAQFYLFLVGVALLITLVAKRVDQTV